MKNRLIVLDRDGVINFDSPDYIKSPEEWRPLPGSLEAIARLCREDYKVVIITNQSGIARGLYSINTLNRIHQKMLEKLQPLGGEISAIFFCPHGPGDGCQCRKPMPGLFHELKNRLKCNLKNIYAVGDSLRDLEAAHSAGARPVLVQTGNGKRCKEDIDGGKTDPAFREVPCYPDLAGFVDTLIESRSSQSDE